MLLPFAPMAQDLLITSPVRFLALGDSYTIGQSVPVAQRWPMQLKDSLEHRGFEIDTVSIIATTGWRTDNLLNAIRSQDLRSENFNLVSLLIGVNNQYQSRPFSQYVNEFPILVDSAIQYAGGDPSRVFIVSIPDYAYTPFGQQSGNAAEISEELDEYNEFSRQVAEERGITYFNITPISRLGLQNPGFVASDGLHPSGVQYTEWVKIMLESIDQQATHILPNGKSDIDLRIFPNPTNDVFFVELKELIPGEYCTIQLYAITGFLLVEERMTQNLHSITLANHPEGLYLLKITSRGKQVVMKIQRG